MELNEGLYTAALVACEKGGQWALALEVIREMHMKGISPSLFAYNAAIFACKKDAQWVQVRSPHGPSRHRAWDTETTICSCLVATGHRTAGGDEARRPRARQEQLSRGHGELSLNLEKSFHRSEGGGSTAPRRRRRRRRCGRGSWTSSRRCGNRASSPAGSPSSTSLGPARSTW
jgi:pentatricopeptide repeat protein